MKRKIVRILFNLALGLLAAVPLARAGTTTFTYQGYLTDAGSPANGNYDLNFRVYDALTLGNQLPQPPGVPITESRPAWPVANGVFTVDLDFGPNVFTGPRRWLEVEVKPGGSAASPVVLMPRTELKPVPYAIYAQNAGGVADDSVTAAKIAPGEVVKSLNGLTDNVTLSAGANVTLTPSGNTIQISTSAGSGPFLLNGTSAYYNGGYVGIGTSSPTLPLDVAGSAQVQGYLQLNGQGNFIDFYSPGDYDFRLISEGSFNTRSFSVFDAATGTRQDRLTIDSSGSVGIGTTAPAAKLHVEAASSPLAVLGVLSQGGAAVRGMDALSDTYGELASVNQSAEFRSGIAVYGHAGTSGLAGQFDGNVVVAGTMNVAADSYSPVISVTTYTAPSALYGYNGSYDTSAAAIRGESNFGFGVKGSSYGVGVSGYNYKSGTFAHLATESFAGQFYGNVWVHGSVSSLSDRNAKANFSPVDASGVLEKVARLPISTWSFKDESGIRHIGPMAQDFYAAFQVGLDDKSICSVDADGVALAAIQGLYQLFEAKDTQIKDQQAELAALKARLGALEKCVSSLTQHN
jgi:hypothetical protein